MRSDMYDSGIKWIGKIPEGWKLVRLKGLFNERKENNNPVKTNFILSLGANYGVVPYAEKEGGGNKAKEDVSEYKLAYPGDIVMNSMNIISGSVALSNYYGCVSPVYYMFYPIDESIDRRYYCYVFKTKAFQRSLLGLGNGIMMKESGNGVFNTVRMRIPVGKLNVLKLPMPENKEQKIIADYLDEKCSYIDNVICKTKESIKEYYNLRQAIINDAVLHGVNKNIKMKIAGLDWIEQIPENWNTIPSKYLFHEVNEWKRDGDVMLTSSVKYGIISQEEYKKREGVNLVSATKELDKWKHVEPNDFIISLMSFKSGLELSQVTGCITWHYIVLKASKEIHHDYYRWLFKSTAYITAIRRTCNFIRNGQDLRFSNFAKVSLIIPPMDEQISIANYLNKKTIEMDELIHKKEAFVEELELLKDAMIYEYVTGKKEVLDCY